jgi:hypothetical protein
MRITTTTTAAMTITDGTRTSINGSKSDPFGTIGDGVVVVVVDVSEPASISVQMLSSYE